VVLIAVLGLPFAVALVVTVAFGRTKRVALAGFLLALVWLVVGYLASPTEPGHCSDCREFLGRWWEPELALFVTGLAFAAWLAGVGLGAAIRRSEAVEIPRVRPPGAQEDVDRRREPGDAHRGGDPGP
jgi:hypothetical protein